MEKVFSKTLWKHRRLGPLSASLLLLCFFKENITTKGFNLPTIKFLLRFFLYSLQKLENYLDCRKVFIEPKQAFQSPPLAKTCWCIPGLCIPAGHEAPSISVLAQISKLGWRVHLCVWVAGRVLCYWVAQCDSTVTSLTHSWF